MTLPWTERVPMLSVNPDAASREDIARLAADLMEAHGRLDALEGALLQVEWIAGYENGEWGVRCAWCWRQTSVGHAPDCPRQRALGEGREP